MNTANIIAIEAVLSVLVERANLSAGERAEAIRRAEARLIENVQVGTNQLAVESARQGVRAAMRRITGE